MGWETRRNGTYFYRKVREGGRVRSVYVGRGDASQFVDALESLSRPIAKQAVAKRKLERERERRERAEQDQSFERLFKALDSIVAGALLASGYHQHKGQWRLRRGTKRNGSGEGFTP